MYCKIVHNLILGIILKTDQIHEFQPGPDPTTSIYKPALQKFTTQLIAKRVFRIRIIFLQCRNALAYHNAGVVNVN
jgi:hypothetical protein